VSTPKETTQACRLREGFFTPNTLLVIRNTNIMFKKLITGLTLLLLASLSQQLLAQAPQGINYQAVLRTANGILTTPVTIGFEIYEGGSLVYSEKHPNVQPDPNSGVVNLVIGSLNQGGSNDFEDIDWSTGNYELTVIVDEGGGQQTTFDPVPFESVPYSLYADQARSVIGLELDEIEDVDAANPSADQVLTFDGSNWTAQTPANTSFWNQNNNGIYHNDGAVGIGTLSPDAELDIEDAGWQLRLDNTGSGASPFFIGSSNNNWLVGGQKLIIDNNAQSSFPLFAIDASNGNVGIGTGNPGAGLEVRQDDIISTDTSGVLSVRLMHNYTGAAGGILIYDKNGNTAIEMQGQETSTTGSEINLRDIDGTQTIVMDAHFGNGGGGDIQLSDENGSTTIRLAADYNGTGDGRIITDEFQITGGSDFAENFDILIEPTLAPEPGMVVSIDPNNTGKLMISSEAYDPKVAGIISGANGIKTGMLMGQEGTLADGKFPIALTGRVYVWADASYGAIEPGTLLTSSPTPGHAQKAVDTERRMGAIIGKAMTSLESGRGYVLVLVNLQ